MLPPSSGAGYQGLGEGGGGLAPILIQGGQLTWGQGAPVLPWGSQKVSRSPPDPSGPGNCPPCLTLPFFPGGLISQPEAAAARVQAQSQEGQGSLQLTSGSVPLPVGSPLPPAPALTPSLPRPHCTEFGPFLPCRTCRCPTTSHPSSRTLHIFGETLPVLRGYRAGEGVLGSPLLWWPLALLRNKRPWSLAGGIRHWLCWLSSEDHMEAGPPSPVDRLCPRSGCSRDDGPLLCFSQTRTPLSCPALASMDPLPGQAPPAHPAPPASKEGRGHGGLGCGGTPGWAGATGLSTDVLPGGQAEVQALAQSWLCHTWPLHGGWGDTSLLLGWRPQVLGVGGSPPSIGCLPPLPLPLEKGSQSEGLEAELPRTPIPS